jgi:CheY-like chemotaxis protein
VKTAYNILWIDDEPDSIDTDIEDVKDYLEEFAIDADIDFVASPADGSIRDLLNDRLKNPDLDLLMVDYHMDGLSGDQLVKLIRDTDHIYLPVVFYSSSPVAQLQDAVRTAELDGVYIANRDYLINKVKDVVGSLLAKEHTVKQVRGLLMEGVSEIDAQFNEIFQQKWANLALVQRETILGYLKGIVSQRAASAATTLENFPSDINSFGEHIVERFLSSSYDTYTRWRLTSKILELAGGTQNSLKELKRFAILPDAQKPLNGLRNDYAHKTRRDLEKDHDTAKCIEIRKALRSQNANIDAILGALE